MLMRRGVVRWAVGGVMLALAACASSQRSHDATLARHRMIGYSKEQVLICMGPPKKKEHEGATDVWLYHSTNGFGTGNSLSTKSSPFTFGQSSHQSYFCDVNIVMTNDIVTAVHYNGPRGGVIAQDEQCGFAVEHCVN